LKDRAKIRRKPDFESDEYNNLLIVEAKITELVKSGRIDYFELAILEFVSTNKTYTELEDVLRIDRNTISKYFRSICDRISFSLGGVFTDEGYLQYVKESNNLTDEDVDKMREHMNSKYRHTIRRSTNDG